MNTQLNTEVPLKDWKIEKLKHTYISSIIFNLIWIFLSMLVLIFWVFYYAYPLAQVKIEKAQEIQKEFENIQKNGVSIGELADFVDNVTIKELIKTESDEIKEIIKKTDDSEDNYLDWLNQRFQEIHSEEQKIRLQERIIGGIIPTFGSYFSTDLEDNIENRITNKKLIEYIERNILTKYNIHSYGQIGIDSIEYLDNADDMYTTGTFTVELKFSETLGRNIKALLNDIYKSGQIKINHLQEIDTTEIEAQGFNPAFSDLSNLLIKIESLSLNNIPSENNVVEWDIVLRFYVKTLSFNEIQILRSNIENILYGTDDIEGLKDKIIELNNFCNLWENKTLCKNLYVQNAIHSVQALFLNISTIEEDLQKIQEKHLEENITNGDILLYLQDIYKKIISIQEALWVNQEIFENFSKQ